MSEGNGNGAAELSKLEKGYEILGELSRDGAVVVYVARDRLSGNEVAIKVVRAADSRGREALAHYASDARMLTALEHSNIVSVHSVKWLSEDVVAVVTERVRGPSLRQVLDVAGTLPVARAREVLRGLGRALAWAHSAQIMHRDVRPENVIFEDGTGRVVLSDFGLARRLDVAGALESTADPYRAPELADGRYPDQRSDVYSLGIVGWELLTGRRPWPDTMDPIEAGQRAPAPPPLAEIRPGLPQALAAAIEGAVQLDRERRIADVVTFMDRLTRLARPSPVEEEEDEEEAPFAVEPSQWVALPVPRIPSRRKKKAPPAEADALDAPGAAADAPTQPQISADKRDRKPGIGKRATTASASDAAVEPAVLAAMAAADEPSKPSVDAPDDRAEAPGPEAAIPSGVDAERPATTAVSPSDVAARSVAGAAADVPADLPAGARADDRSEVQAGASGHDDAGVEEMPIVPVADASIADARADDPPPVEPYAGEIAASATGDRPVDQSDAAPFRASGTFARPLDEEPAAGRDRPSLTGPVLGPVRGGSPAHGPEREPARFGTMRGGLGTPRPPREGRARESARDANATPLEPVWDTPAEFPLPVIPDPRPMPADSGASPPSRRRWTRRGIAIGGVATLLVVVAVALARMQQPSDSLEGLMQPENPTGYGGDVVLERPAVDTSALTGDAPGATVQPGAGDAPGTASRSGANRAAPAVAAPSAPASRTTTPAPATAAGRASATRPNRTPPGAARSGTADNATTRSTRAASPAVSPARNASERAEGIARCSSPALADQRACLGAHLARSDAGLNQVYQDVITALRRRANTAPGDPDPPEVERLRAAQRNWLVRRDVECRRRGRGREGRLWATPRAQCLEQFSVGRAQELSNTLAGLRRD